MPGMGGVEATRQILATAPKISVVAVSLHADPQVRDAMRVAGASCFVDKGDGAARLPEVLGLMAEAIAAQKPSPQIPLKPQTAKGTEGARAATDHGATGEGGPR